jgi:hypothetical protein
MPASSTPPHRREHQDHQDHEDHHLVRPRRIWLGVGSAVAGMVLTGVEMTVGTTGWTLVGAAVIVVGLLVAWRGGIICDTHADKALRHEVKAVVQGDVHQGTSPADRLSHGHQALAHEPRDPSPEVRSRVPTPALAPLGAAGLLVLATWLLVGPWIVRYPHTVHGNANAEHAIAFSVVLALSGLWIRQVGPAGPPPLWPSCVASHSSCWHRPPPTTSAG